MPLFIFLPASLIVGAVAAHLLRLVMKSAKLKIKATPRFQNIGLTDRRVRLSLAVFLLVYGLFNPNAWIFAASGFVFYEAFAKWCALYAVLGKNTCPLN